MTNYDCPNCGASVHDDGVSETLRCHFCATDIGVRHRQIRSQQQDWDARIAEANKRGLEDFLLPPIGCCGIYFGLFVIGSMILTAIGKEVAKQYGTAVAAIAVGAALIGAVLIIWQRETRRRKRVVELERDRMQEQVRTER